MLARVWSSWGKWLKGSPRSAGAVAEEDRRAFGRIPCDVETTCQPTSRDRADRWPARVRNVSRGGACLRLPRSFQLGELLSVSLPAKPEESTGEVLACVVRCDEVEGDGWEVGCTFATALGETDLRRFEFPRGEGVLNEQRHWVRHPCRAEVVYQVVQAKEMTQTTGASVLNISGGGVALQVADSLHVGDLLSVELRRDGAAILTALASVVRTTVERTGERIVGCNFIHELSEAQLAQLLA